MSAPATFQRFLGSSFVHSFDRAVLTIGGQSLTRYDLVRSLDCAATSRAAGILTKALADLGVKTVRDALNVNPVDLATLPGVGVTAIYVFLCWQRVERGSLKAVEAWEPDVTVATLKERVRKRKARETPKRKSKGRALRAA